MNITKRYSVRIERKVDYAAMRLGGGVCTSAAKEAGNISEKCILGILSAMVKCGCKLSISKMKLWSSSKKRKFLVALLLTCRISSTIILSTKKYLIACFTGNICNISTSIKEIVSVFFNLMRCKYIVRSSTMPDMLKSLTV